VLGIIACRALEDELAHVLSEDHELRHLILINNLDCFIANLDTGLNFASDFQVESMINWFASQYNLEVVRLRGSVKIADICYRQAKEGVNRSVCKSRLGTPEGYRAPKTANLTKV